MSRRQSIGDSRSIDAHVYQKNGRDNDVVVEAAHDEVALQVGMGQKIVEAEEREQNERFVLRLSLNRGSAKRWRLTSILKSTTGS